MYVHDVCVAEVTEVENYHFPLSLSSILSKTLWSHLLLYPAACCWSYRTQFGVLYPFNLSPHSFHRGLGWGCLSRAKSHNSKGFKRYSENNMNKNKTKEECSLNKKERIITLRSLFKSRPGFWWKTHISEVWNQLDKTHLMCVCRGWFEPIVPGLFRLRFLELKLTLVTLPAACVSFA